MNMLDMHSRSESALDMVALMIADFSSFALSKRLIISGPERNVQK